MRELYTNNIGCTVEAIKRGRGMWKVYSDTASKYDGVARKYKQCTSIKEDQRRQNVYYAKDTKNLTILDKDDKVRTGCNEFAKFIMYIKYLNARIMKTEPYLFVQSAMAETNKSSNQDVDFLLIAFPAFQDLQYMISVPFSIMLLVALFGNITVFLIIFTEKSLHEPMYYFMSILTVIDLLISVTVLPEMLVLLWFGEQAIKLDVCFTQMAFILFFASMESAILLLMAFDRYTAVCNPLKYSGIITNTFVLKGSLLAVAKGFCIAVPLIIFVKMLPFCRVTTLSHVFCEYPAVINVACAQSSLSIASLYILLFAIVLETALIGLSYYMIVKVVITLKSKESWDKVVSTCSSHFFLILSFYLSTSLTLVGSILENKIPAYIRVLFSALYITIPPTLNPLIYGIKTKEIRQVIIKRLRKFRMIS
ncbi:olfactory receptor 52K2-like [Protopterus annectens]|uniref:olfactory receptor 52K2-like n=1 Tax=Protopterus annectens TaxID=7888 RepID=UPI001CFA4247|nr:olfactory receptor 52K2-like [Protopterus annectens]